jgi:hypothetical protein
LTADDRIALVDLFTRYAWAYDCSDVDECAAVFTPDGVMAGDVGGATTTPAMAAMPTAEKPEG